MRANQIARIASDFKVDVIKHYMYSLFSCCPVSWRTNYGVKKKAKH